jgi:HAD superfamily hydrolase (TIGR01509 family)
MLRALIFDVDGTLADTEEAHRQAFNAAFAQAGLDWYWDENLYTRLLRVAGGKERIAHYWHMIGPDEVRVPYSPTDVQSPYVRRVIDEIHASKTRHYEDRIGNGKLSLRPGVERLIREAQAAGVPMAIASTTTACNIDALLRTPLGPDWRRFFAAVCAADTVPRKKPAPDVYLAALAGLGIPADDCLAFEDSENGLRAATAAGIPTLVTPTGYTDLQDFEEALLVVPHLGDPELPMAQRIPGTDHRWIDLAALRCWHAGMLLEAS